MPLNRPVSPGPLRASLPFVITLLVGCGADDATPSTRAPDLSERACPSMPLPSAHAEIAIAPPIDRDRRLQLEVVVDGAEERCTLRVSGVAPEREGEGVVESPATQAEVDCPSLEVAGIRGDGAIDRLRTVGRPTSLSIRALEGDAAIGSASADPLQYAPHEPWGEGCGEFDLATLPLSLAQ